MKDKQWEGVKKAARLEMGGMSPSAYPTVFFSFPPFRAVVDVMSGCWRATKKRSDKNVADGQYTRVLKHITIYTVSGFLRRTSAKAEESHQVWAKGTITRSRR